MAAFENARMETLAQGLAAGLALHEATAAAGFSRQNGMSRRRAARADVTTRVAQIAAERIAKAADLVPVIDQLMTLAAKAETMTSAAALSAARGLLAEAVKVKAMLPAKAAGRDEEPRVPNLNKEERLKAFSPHWEERSGK